MCQGLCKKTVGIVKDKESNSFFFARRMIWGGIAYDRWFSDGFSRRIVPSSNIPRSFGGLGVIFRHFAHFEIVSLWSFGAERQVELSQYSV